MKLFLPLALAASLSACATMPAVPVTPSDPVVAAPTPLERAAAAFDLAELSYARLRDWSLRIEPFLPATWRVRLIHARDIADRALVAARAARTLAEQAQALRELNTASSDLIAASGR